MNIKPKKIKDILSKVSNDTGYEEVEINNLIVCFYEDWVKKHLTSFDEAILQIEHLGSFVFRSPYFEQTIHDLDAAEKIFKTQLLKEKTRDKKTEQKYIDMWEKSLKRIAEAKEKIKILQNKIKEQRVIKDERFNEKLKNYEDKQHLEKS